MRKLLVFLWVATWAYLCLIPTLESGTASYLAWRDAGCPDFASSVPRAFCPRPEAAWRGMLLWLVSTPFLAWALWRTPRVWPARLSHRLWNPARTGLSLVSLFVNLAVLVSVWIGAQRAPYAAAAVSNYIALLPIALAGFWYRAVLLSAEKQE